MNPQGCVRTKTILKIFIPQHPIKRIEPKIFKQTKQYSILEACGFYNEQRIATLTIVLIPIYLKEEIIKKIEPLNQIGESFVISQEEIYQFSKVINDQNLIHLTDQPVV